MTIDVGALKALWQQAFGDTDALIDGFFRVGFSPERCRFTEIDGQAAAALYWFDCRWEDKKIAYIYGVATATDFRGQGLCRRLMEDTHRQLAAVGYAGAVLVPADAGLAGMYRKMGYRDCCPTEKLSILPGVDPARIEQISPEEYGRLRIERLPKGSIVQGQAVLDFYSTYGAFYRSGSALFCVARENDVLYFQEFLGDRAELPGIVAALEGASAQVRLPGGEQPFAMYRSFTEDRLPEYLGFALD
jgi:GNAT superfamily N-acetyltransferase